MAECSDASGRAASAASHVAGQGSALVLLHGLGGTWEAWRPVLSALEARHHFLALTLPGHHGGPPYAGAGDASVAGIADQLIAMLRAQGVKRAHVAGNSLGGWLSSWRGAPSRCR
jgi:pimeloyl-ACP methyl ester carboxylesterase